MATGVPLIEGTPEEGKTLTEKPTEWSPTPTAVVVHWEYCEGEECEEIPGASGTTYVVSASYVGDTIRVEEIAYSESTAGMPAFSQPTEVIAAITPENTAPPTVSGTPEVGQTLSAKTGTWLNGSTYTYQWEACSGATCTAIAGATEATYVPVAGQTGSTLRVAVTAKGVNGRTASKESAVTAAIETDLPVNTRVPSISGTVAEGDTATVTRGEWNHGPDTVAVQWEQCNSSGGSCTAISGATSNTLAITEAEGGFTLRVTETARNAAGAGTPVSSATTAVVPTTPLSNTVAAYVKGTATPGAVISVNVGEWAGHPTSFTYQWMHCQQTHSEEEEFEAVYVRAFCQPVGGATEPTYTVPKSDDGLRIYVELTAHKADGETNTVGTAQTPVVYELSAAQQTAILRKGARGELDPSILSNPIPTAEEALLMQGAGEAFVAGLECLTNSECAKKFSSHQKLTFKLPNAGTFEMEYIGSAYTAVGSRAGAHAARAKRIVLARASAKLTRRGKVKVQLLPTKAGKALIKPHSTLVITTVIRFKPKHGKKITKRASFLYTPKR